MPFHFFMEKFTEFISHFPDAKTFLDLGTGNGFFADKARKKGFTVHAIDKENTLDTEYRNTFSFKELDIEKEKPTGTFDIIFARNIFQHVTKKRVVKTIIPHLLFMLKKNGSLYVLTFSDKETMATKSKYLLSDFPQLDQVIHVKKWSETAEKMEGGKHKFHRLLVIYKK